MIIDCTEREHLYRCSFSMSTHAHKYAGQHEPCAYLIAPTHNHIVRLALEYAYAVDVPRKPQGSWGCLLHYSIDQVLLLPLIAGLSANHCICPALHIIYIHNGSVVWPGTLIWPNTRRMRSDGLTTCLCVCFSKAVCLHRRGFGATQSRYWISLRFMWHCTASDILRDACFDGRHKSVMANNRLNTEYDSM